METLRRKRGMKELHRLRDRHQPVKQVNWEQVKKVGVLYNAADPKIAEEAQEFFRFLQQEGKQPYTLGYMHINDQKQLPATRLGFDYFCRRSLDGKMLPTATVAKNFMEEPFDILFDLNIENLFPLHAVSVLSKAHLKAGLDLPENRHLHLTIQLDASQPVHTVLHYLIDNLKSYVREIYV